MSEASPQPLSPPFPAVIYKDSHAVFTALQSHARTYGFAVTYDTVHPNKANAVRIHWKCDKGGKYRNSGKNPTLDSSRRRQNTGSKKTGCKYQVIGRKDSESGSWTIEIKDPSHNHGASITSVLPAHRIASITPEIKDQIIAAVQVGQPTQVILATLRKTEPEVVLKAKDIYNITQAARIDQLGGKSPLQWLVSELQEKGFNPQYSEQDKHLTRLFFIHPTGLLMFKQNPDVLLLDCTYKTNRFQMPLLNICAVNGQNKVIQFGLCFLQHETEEDYNWAMTQLHDTMIRTNIDEPLSIITDRELALMRSLDTYFPRSKHLLCQWHVNMNVLSKTKAFFPPPIRDPVTKAYTRHPDFQAFLRAWNSLLRAESEAEFNQQLVIFRADYPSKAVSYCVSTWLVLWKEKLVSFWVNKSLHFGVRVTSPVEGCHTGLKACLKRSSQDLIGVYEKLLLFWDAQQRRIEDTIALKQSRLLHSLNKPVFLQLRGTIHEHALLLLNHEMQKLGSKNEAPDLQEVCSCKLPISHGLPCFHKIWMRQQASGYIELSDIHRHWYIVRPDVGTTPQSIVPLALKLLDPKVVHRKGRPKGALDSAKAGSAKAASVPASNGASGIRRNLSAFEYSSSTPPAINAGVSNAGVTVVSRPQSQYFDLPSHSIQRGTTQFVLSSTALAMERLEAGHRDAYEPGTVRERRYLNTQFGGGEGIGDGNIIELQVQPYEFDPKWMSRDAPFEWDKGEYQ